VEVIVMSVGSSREVSLNESGIVKEYAAHIRMPLTNQLNEFLRTSAIVLRLSDIY
jgi:hypothetical protein